MTCQRFQGQIAALVMIVAACGGGSSSAGPTPAPEDSAVFLEADGLGILPFDTSPAAALETLEPYLGTVADDTEWIDGTDGIYGRCPEHLRVLSWGSLVLFYSAEAVPADTSDLDTGRFFAYSYGFDFDEAIAGVDPIGLDLRTVEGIGLGDSGEKLEELDDVIVEPDTARNVIVFAIDADEQPHLRGFIDGSDPSGPISFLETTTACD